MPANKTGPAPKKKKGRRGRLVAVAVVLLLVAGIAFGSFWGVNTVRASLPQTTGSLKLAGLTDPVDVRRDAHGIPQIYADTDEDLFRAQGYVQAQDRFWEMDVRRHMTAGRLSEMFGKDQVDTDAFLRTLGWHRVAQQEYDTKLSPATKKYLQAYSAGVNAYLKDHEGAALSLEYAALDFQNDYKPEKWTPVDSVAWLKAMAWDLRGNMQDEIDRSLMTSRFTAQQIAELYPAYPYQRSKPIVSGGAVNPVTKEFDPKGSGTGNAPNGTPAGAAHGLQSGLSALSTSLDKIPALLGPNGNGIGSNSWVVSGAHTTTGKPLLANDPHLAPQMPSLWYQMGLHCRTTGPKCTYDVAGYTFSGMPGVIIGHNQDVSWGMTNLGADVTDLYLEKVTTDGYLYDGRRRPFTTRKETIKVAGGPSREITVRATNNGPIVSDRDGELATVGKRAPVGNAAPDRGDGYALSLRWTALDPGASMDAVFELNRAKDWTSFRKAAADFEVPSQNLIYADTKGNIGYQAPGRIPVRGKGDGTLPAPGWDPDYRWTGVIPQSALPWEYNPARGYIVTANQAVVDEKKYPYLLTKDWGYGARSQRINDLIESKIKDGGKVSTDDMQSFQQDNSSQIARILTPYLTKVNISDPYVREAQQLLDGWDFTQEPDSAAAAYFNGVWRNLLKLAFGNKMPKELRVKGQCLTVRPAGGSGPVDDLAKFVRECGERAPDRAQPDGGDRWYEVVRAILDDPTNAWWKTEDLPGHPGDKNRDQLLAHAMKDARYELTSKLGKNIDNWTWGRLHQMFLKNQTLGTEGPGFLQGLFNRGPWNVGGGEAAVNATGWNASGGYGVTWVPSMRMVVNLADLDKSRWINLTGASGHAYDAHYYDQTDKWAKGELLPWSFGEAAVKKGTKDTLTLTP
ncbi:penicillin acylase family protein [Streptomyces benahoarensis]|uniref:Penicillin acylase family protein n=1 Tax=Streptomyces benahoarensis TaxID=2595054 RepID=A0A553ZH28_9ACTN|nr:penicillin acylase family protein [Streptomyces benahoarensis]TSB21919.1 penicillin acylase family protein [Streptomyces benahoarensis]TSB40710.1 penicillin acylase family protein [Streptomyces benahoarensis]